MAQNQLEWGNMYLSQCGGVICTRQTKRDNFPIDVKYKLTSPRKPWQALTSKAEFCKILTTIQWQVSAYH
eukprot:gene2134-13081_t